MKELFVGRKINAAMPMTRGDYNKLRGWELPADENPDDPGYLVEYLDSPNSVHPDYDNYISWSPKDVFDNAHHSLGEIRDYPAFYQRLVAEQVELASNIEKLDAYLQGDDSKSNAQRPLLQLQIAHMRGLNSILLQRVMDLRDSLSPIAEETGE